MTYEADVLVIGGGNAGCVAALAAARRGADVLLVERYGFLGGTATAAMVGPWMTFHAGERRVVGGIAQEIVDRLRARGASPGHLPDASSYVPTITPFDPEVLKWVLFEMMAEAGVRLVLHAWLLDALTDGARVRGARFATVGGIREARARIAVDATADAHLAASAGVAMQRGDARGRVQPCTMIFRLSHVDREELAAYLRTHPGQIRTHLDAAALRGGDLTAVAGLYELWEAARAAGEVSVPRELVSLFATPYDDEMTVNMTRVTDVDPLDPDDLTRAEIEGRRQAMEIAAFFRRRVPGFRNARLAATAVQLGVRETRRIVGEYVLTAEDLLTARRFPDAVARSGYPIDIHHPSGAGTETKRLPPGETYEIPYRCLVPRGVDGLLVAGRCISTTHEALASTRLTPTVMTLGQAAGTAAQICASEGVEPRALDAERLRASLLEDGVDLGVEAAR
ncbi:MAG TPA: FAD-dependent oxidoreductase [Candidatus Dormibacteraeota bacterium]|nr:FAD-dependent oxidoreductase [Candidatus Dormibacteraeota bacterium]